MARSFAVLASLWLSLSGAEAFAQSATIQNLGYLNPADRSAAAYNVSPDGQVVVGASNATNSPTDPRHGFRWSQTDAIQDLGALGSLVTNRSAANGISANGVIVGYAADDSGKVSAFRMTGFGGMQPLPSLGVAEAYNASDDGATVVGYYVDAGSRSHAVSWLGSNPAAANSLGTIGGAVGDSVAQDCSADGSIIAGYSWNGSAVHACLFRVAKPPLDLGSLTGPSGASRALATSANGTVVVGDATTSSGGRHAMVWKASTGMVDLGTVDRATGNSIAYTISGNGRLIGGSSANASRPGGEAAVWIDGKPRQLWDLLINDYGADMGLWTSFATVRGASWDGTVLVGSGTYDGVQSAFRIKLTPNKIPNVAAPKPVSVECTGGANKVVLSAKANDADSTDRLTVTWKIGGEVRKRTENVVPGSTVTFSFNYRDGETPVVIGVTDGTDSTSATTKVTVVDTKSPIVVVADDVRVKVDPGKTYASGVVLKKPFVDDVCDPRPKVTSNAKARYPIGTTKVTWTVRDKSGNVAKAVQRVIVRSAPPTASAGSNVTQTTTGSSVHVKLDGSRSNAPSGHKLTYLWKAPGVAFSNADSVRTTAEFPLGETDVTLTVTDEMGGASTDRIRITVYPARTARTAATLADASVREAQLNGLDSYSRGKGDSLNAAGLSLAYSAFALGTLAGDALDTGEAIPSSHEELTSYLALRATAAQQARMAGDRFYESFLVSGDGNALAASMYAYYGSGYSFSDLSSNDKIEVPMSTIEE